MSSPMNSKDSVHLGVDRESAKAAETWSEGDEDEDDGGPKERKRRRPMSVSCETCKLRKVRCDRSQPSCGWCIRNNAACEYKERKKPGLRAGYGRELEARLEKLEDAMQNQQNALQQLSSSLGNPQAECVDASSSSHHPSRVETALFMQSPVRPYASAAMAMPAQALQSQMVDDMKQQGTSFLRYASQPSMHAPGDASSGDGYQTADPPVESPSLNIGGTGKAASTPGFISYDEELPPYDLLYALTDLFFQHVNTFCPILNRRTTLDVLFGAAPLDEPDRVLLHAIVATTLRYSQDPRLVDSSRQRYYAVSKQKVLLYGLENSSVRALQALVILSLDVMGTSNGPPAWNLLALITRSVVQLGLSVETSSTSVAPVYPSIYTLRAMVLPEPKSWIEDESRRRLFWQIYILDRYATVATAFEFCLDEKEVDRNLPCRDDLWARDEPVNTKRFKAMERSNSAYNNYENLGSFSYYVEVVGILSQIHIFLKRPVDISALHDVEKWQQEYRDLDSQLRDWKFSLPNEYGNISRMFNRGGPNDPVDVMWIMLHVTHQTALIRLHSSSAYPTTRSPIFTPSFSASQRCHGAAEQICELCNHVKNNNMLTQLGPSFAFSLWVAARLLLVHGSTIDHKVNPAIALLVETLREMGNYWKVAERYATLLQRVLDEYHESERAPVGASGVRETPSTVRILSDMRRTAFDLDFLISRQPKQHFGSKTVSATPVRTPARTPAPEDLEYLDVFDFFNMPRLPAPTNVDAAFGAEGGLYNEPTMAYPDLSGNGNEFNITNFTYDANSDWFMNST